MADQQKNPGLKSYVLAECPDCHGKLFIKQVFSVPEVDAVLSETQVKENKDKIKAAVVEKQVFANAEELAAALQEVDNPSIVYDDVDTQRALEGIAIQALKSNKDVKQETTTK